MRAKYAVVVPERSLGGGYYWGRVFSTHTMLHKALESRKKNGLHLSVRELVAPAGVGERIRIEHLHEWS